MAISETINEKYYLKKLLDITTVTALIECGVCVPSNYT